MNSLYPAHMIDGLNTAGYMSNERSDETVNDPQTKTKCLPVYLVVDTSQSMQPHEALLNDTVENVFTMVGDSPRVAEFAHVSIITFNTAPHVVLEMTNIEDIEHLPVLACQGTTNYGKMFTTVKQRIDIDVNNLNRQGRAILRPAVFILTDGEPTDKNWADSYSTMSNPDWKRRPHVISFGFGAADEAVLGRISNKAAYRADGNEKEAITSMLTTLLQTLVQSANAQELRIPTTVPGYTSVPIEYVD